MKELEKATKPENPSRSAIEALVKKAIDRLLADDGDLLQNDVNERSITHRFACYLQELFPEWNVDCEYNRNHDEIKKLVTYQGKTVKANDTDGVSVFPDIIVHKRISKKNLLVIEVKKTTNSEPDKFDLDKLEAFKKDLYYEHALFIRLKAGVKENGAKTFEWKWA